MITYFNQLTVILRSCKHDRQNKYGALSILANDKAMSVLSDKAYKIWVAICLNQDGYQFALSPAYLTKKCNISESSYRRAVKEFKEKGYLKCLHDDVYEFFEYPNLPPKPITSNIITDDFLSE